MCAGVGSRGRFRKVLESPGVWWCKFRRQVPEGSRGFRCVLMQVSEASSEGSGGFRFVPAESSRVSEGLGVVCCLATLTGTAM